MKVYKGKFQTSDDMVSDLLFIITDEGMIVNALHQLLPYPLLTNPKEASEDETDVFMSIYNNPDEDLI